MKKFKTLNLWFAFVGTVFFILLATSIVTIFITFFMIHSGWIRIAESSHFPPLPIIMLLVASIAIGTAITLFVGRKVLKPISDFSHATTHVAKGDFNVRLNYNGRVDELREMAINFNTMVTELGSIETLKNDFVVTVSHEFKTPLASIEGYAKMLQNPDISPKESLEYTRTITKSTKQLNALASNILKISNLESQEIIRDMT
ncbi:MAG TPA: HAMP domain-containing sensor histidine kinase, partial [Anaerovoracaceae bacterium]|nr:HAMP domain-containing sensor histidine kinase [Anaerovoracaceae bacterium]